MKLPEGFRHIALGSVGSTMVEAMDRAKAGDSGDVWITATEQLSGKARRGREWVSKPGNLYSSLLLVDPAKSDGLATLPHVVAVALHEALVVCCNGMLDDCRERFTIKWPNDVLLDGKKISGILLEATPLPDGRHAVVIGCGVNCAHFPDNPLYPATSLLAHNVEISPETLFHNFANTMAAALEQWECGRNFAAIRTRWLAAAKGIGDPVTARFSDSELHGTFKALDVDGRLVLIDDNETEHRIAAADIFFGESTR